MVGNVLNSKQSVVVRSPVVHASVKKLSSIADLVRGKRIDVAMLQLKFNAKRTKCQEFIKVLKQAVSSAENNHGMDIDSLFVSEVCINRAGSARRFRAKAKGKAGPIVRRYSRIVLHVSYIEA